MPLPKSCAVILGLPAVPGQMTRPSAFFQSHHDYPYSVPADRWHREQAMAQVTKPKAKKPRLVGMNHVALEVADIEAALAFYGAIFDFKLRSKSRTQAFIDMGDQV